MIDVDGHNFPNLALMKLSAWHKAKGDTVEWWWTDMYHYDVVYMSKVFSSEKSSAPQEVRYLQRWCNNRLIFRAEPDFKKYDPKRG